MKLTLFQKAAIALAVPLAVQIAAGCGFYYLQKEAEEQALREEHARKVSSAAIVLTRDVLKLLTDTQNDQFTNATFTFAKYNDGVHAVRVDLDNLSELVKNDPADSRILAEVRSGFAQAQQSLVETVRAYRQGNMHEVLETSRKTHDIMKEYGVRFTNLAVDEINRMDTEVLGKASDIDRQNRQNFRNLLLFVTIFDVLWLLLLLNRFSMDVSTRLGVLMRNSFRLASNEKLESPVTGSDEIATLDNAIHQVADTLVEVKKREQAILENALDVICSTDDRLRFKVLSPACRAVFGYAPDQLEGSRLLSLVVDGDVTRTSELIQSMMQSAACSATIENQVKQKSGKIVDIHWSLHWSKEQESFFCVARDVSEMKEAERLKQEVVQMVTHDLRSPLSAIQNFHELLEIGICGELSEKGFTMLHAAQRSADRMMRLVNELLDLEKIKGGMMTISVRSASLMELFEQAVQGVPLKSGPDAVQIDVAPTKFEVVCDPDRITQVLTNLLSNAVKFSPPGGKVTLCASSKEQMIEIRVQDKGRGIPADMLDKIFEPFQQVATSDATVKGGTGLGLAICRGIIELHGGKIGVESREGSGSTFCVLLPSAVTIAQKGGEKPAESGASSV